MTYLYLFAVAELCCISGGAVQRAQLGVHYSACGSVGRTVKGTVGCVVELHLSPGRSIYTIGRLQSIGSTVRKAVCDQFSVGLLHMRPVHRWPHHETVGGDLNRLSRRN